MIEPAHAQYGFEVWNVDNGMPENEIRGITQTPDGYLWIATFNGLARFDGVHLTVFSRESPGPPFESIRHNVAGTRRRPVARQRRSWPGPLPRWRLPHLWQAGVGLPGATINGLTGDDHGDVWVLSAGGLFDGMKHQTISSTSRRQVRACGIGISCCGTPLDSGSANMKRSAALPMGALSTLRCPGKS